MAVVIASNLRKELAGTVLFDGVSFSVERRDRVARSGPNGAGKTTRLRILAGATETPSGSFTLALDGVAPPHGTLQVLANVLAVAGTNCGPGDTERIAVDF